MPSTAGRLKAAAINLGWEDNFLVTEAAIANRIGEAYFTSFDDMIGQENKGLGNTCGNTSDPISLEQHRCKKVQVYTLDHYMENVAKKKTVGLIDHLSIDVEGFDFDVMLGGQQSISRTKYLEFEYNWMGSWSGQKLMDAIKMLDGHGFTCYFAGVKRLWRIDESCWLDHFDWHVWSNVACAHRVLFPEVARNMEQIFLNTLDEDITY